MKKIICIGSATKDVFVPLDNVKILDNPKEITEKKLMAFEYGAKIYSEKIMEEAGGSAVNIASGLSKVGARTFVFSRTSKDGLGKWILKRLGKLKVKKNYMQQNSAVQAEVSIILIDKKNIDHVIIRTGDSTKLFNIKKATEKFREKVDWIFMASQKEGWEDNFKNILQFAKIKKAKVALNPSGYQISHGAKKLLKSFKDFEIVFLNRDEAIELVKNSEGEVKDDIASLYAIILGYGCKNLVITDAEKGAYAGNRQAFHFLEIAAGNKVDAVGAGDAFASGFLACFMEKQDLPNSLVWGINNSASVVSKIGALQGLLTKKELVQKEKNLLGKIKTIKTEIYG